MSVSTDTQIQIVNATLAGMTFYDACYLAGLNITDITSLEADTFFMSEIKSAEKKLEMNLLSQMSEVIANQIDLGKENAIVWMLEHINPQRWSNKNEDTSKKGIVNINFAPLTADDAATIEVNEYADDVKA